MPTPAGVPVKLYRPGAIRNPDRSLIIVGMSKSNPGVAMLPYLSVHITFEVKTQWERQRAPVHYPWTYRAMGGETFPLYH